MVWFVGGSGLPSVIAVGLASMGQGGALRAAAAAVFSARVASSGARRLEPLGRDIAQRRVAPYPVVTLHEGSHLLSGICQVLILGPVDVLALQGCEERLRFGVVARVAFAAHAAATARSRDSVPIGVRGILASTIRVVDPTRLDLASIESAALPTPIRRLLASLD